MTDETLDPEPLTALVEATRAERARCASAVCDRCRAGHAVTWKDGRALHLPAGGLPVQVCAAGAIWRAERC